MNMKKLALVCCVAVGFSGCSSMSTGEKRTLGGAGIGAASGALIGGLTGGSALQGAVIGTAVGATTGWLYNRHKEAEE